jgi:predicted transcriptional regulator
VLAGDGSPLSGHVLARLELDKATAYKALRRLAATAEVERTDGAYAIVDPLFAEWISRL